MRIVAIRYMQINELPIDAFHLHIFDEQLFTLFDWSNYSEYDRIANE